MMQMRQGAQPRLFFSPAEVAAELRISTSTVLRMIHAGKLPAIAVSERIYRIPVATLERFLAGTLRDHTEVQLREGGTRPRIGEGEILPEPQMMAGTSTR
jgi:excisionase family DNA binding protein